ncbi:uncharacterized protein RAG0_00361 [Rhynchosporium agropyri]|uniref:Uncharacterized protein n=1 Tax=Rhynchosporium agropyri TaxID=914238 RepID=A0A1E1JS82_9HELO|nr:uncharacterized protein RAG0_00361 [Rhynchosporium agropyri]
MVIWWLLSIVTSQSARSVGNSPTRYQPGSPLSIAGSQAPGPTPKLSLVTAGGQQPNLATSSDALNVCCLE